MSMQAFLAQYSVLWFAVLWFVVTTSLSLAAGWYASMRAFPDRGEEEPIDRLRHLSGTMGAGVNMRGILGMDVCRTGLRVSINRLFGPFSRPFFVPWEQIDVSEGGSLFGSSATLRFGHPVVGKIVLSRSVVSRIAPPTGGGSLPVAPFAAPAPGALARSLLLRWAASTAFAAVFFTVAPRLVSSKHSAPTSFDVTSVLFPAVVFAVVFIRRWFAERPSKA